MFTGVAKLLSYLNRVFDKTPDSALAFRLNADGTSLVWTVTETEFTTTVTGGTAQPLTLPLSGYTIATLAAYLAAQPGYTVLSLNSEVSGRSARTLVPGTNTQQASNGDHLYAFRSPLWSYLAASTEQLNDAHTQIWEMLAQLIVTEADGEWADHWGTYYKVARRTGEADADYTARIIYETLRPKSNALAMETVLEDAGLQQVDVREPWKERFIPSRSRLSGPHRIQNADFYWYNVLEVCYVGDDALARELAEMSKPAGTRMWYCADLIDTPLSANAVDALAAFREKFESSVIVTGAIGPRSYNSGGTVYDEWGNPYSGVTEFTETRLYTVNTRGTAGATIPLHAGAVWLIPFLEGLGYLAGDTELAVTEHFYEPLDSVGTSFAQQS